MRNKGDDDDDDDKGEEGRVEQRHGDSVRSAHPGLQSPLPAQQRGGVCVCVCVLVDNLCMCYHSWLLYLDLICHVTVCVCVCVQEENVL